MNAQAPRPAPKSLRPVLRSLAPLLSLVVVAAAFWIGASDHPLSILDARTIGVHAMMVGTASVGMTLVIVSGSIDLSVGSVVALASVVTALCLRAGAPTLAGVLAGIATGAACGVYNGALVTLLRIPAFIATLGTLGFFRGVAKWACDSRPVSAPGAGLEALVSPVPTPAWLLVAPGVWLMGVIAAGAGFMVRRTVFGRHIVAVGDNEEAARRCALPVARVRTLTHTIAGALVGLAGVLQFARLTQGDPTVAAGLELDVIAAVVIGGASLSGGQGSIMGSVAGAVLMAFLRNRCTALGWPNFVQEMIVGHIIIGAVALDRWRARSGL